MNQTKIIVALDFADAASALALVDRLDPALCRLKVGKELFIIRSGRVRVLVKSRGRAEIEVASLGPNQFFGEMSLMTGENRKASVVAAEATELLVIDKDSIRPILDAAPEIAETISRVLAARAQALGVESAAGHTVSPSAFIARSSRR